MNEEVKRIYKESLEDQPYASEAVKSAYANIHSALDDYIEAVQQDAFAWGFELGGACREKQ